MVVMLFMAFVVAFLSNGDCKKHGKGDRSEAVSYFNVEVKSYLCGKSTMKEAKFPKNGEFMSNAGNTVELTCREYSNNRNFSLQWRDLYGFETDKVYSNYTENGIRLQMIPDEDDDNLQVTCHSSGSRGGSRKEISITLVVGQRMCNTGADVKNDLIFLKKGQGYTIDDPCQGLVYYPTISKHSSPVVVSENFKIKSFSEMLNGTALSCITYQYIGIEGSEFYNNTKLVQKLNKVATYERRKSKSTFYLEPEVEKRTQRVTETEINTEPDSQSSAVAVVGGVLGTIILLLVSVILVIWYRKKQRRNSDGAADQVIYAEIDEMPSPPPPRREERPYAKIIGSLVPKTQA